MAVPVFTVFAPDDGDLVPITFTAHGLVVPVDATVIAWAVDANGARTNGQATYVEGSDWAFDFDVLLPGPCIVTVEGQDETVNPPDVGRVHRHVTVSPPYPGGGTG